MTFKELQEIHGPQVEAEWHQHKNGGGWVHNSAKVDASAKEGYTEAEIVEYGHYIELFQKVGK